MVAVAVTAMKELTHPGTGATARPPSVSLVLLCLDKQSDHCSRASEPCQAIPNFPRTEKNPSSGTLYPNKSGGSAHGPAREA